MIVGILLAAGAGQRFGGNKLLAELGDGKCIAELSCARLRPTVDRLIAVVRPDADLLSQKLQQAGAEVCICPNAEEGMGTSLAFGVRQAADAEGWLIALADMPCLADADIRRIAETLRAGATIVVPVAGEQRGHPVGFSRRFFAELSALNGDAGARAILARHAAEIISVPIADAATWQDIDTREDLCLVAAQTQQHQTDPGNPA